LDGRGFIINEDHVKNKIYQHKILIKKLAKKNKIYLIVYILCFNNSLFKLNTIAKLLDNASTSDDLNYSFKFIV
jgi:hypothetical protein